METACLNGGGGPQIGEVTSGGSPHLSFERDQIKIGEQAGYLALNKDDQQTMIYNLWSTRTRIVP